MAEVADTLFPFIRCYLRLLGIVVLLDYTSGLLGGRNLYQHIKRTY